MKKCLLIHLLTFWAMFNLAAQGFDFAPVGAKWYYDELDFIPIYIIPHIIESVAKENYQGKWCSKVVPSSSGSILNPTYVYTENDTVYYYSSLSNRFEMLYDFTAEVGDSWVIGGLQSQIPDSTLFYANDTVRVDSISSILLSGVSLKVWHVSNSYWFDWGKRIIEKVGNDFLFLPRFGLFDVNIGGLRCFESPSEAYHLVPYPCDTTYSTISTTVNLEKTDGIEVSPNPFSNEIKVQLPARVGVNPQFVLYDLLGREIKSVVLDDFETILSLAGYPSGMYVWQLRWKGVATQSGRVVKM